MCVKRLQGILMFAVKLILDRTPELKKDELVPEIAGNAKSSEPQTPVSPERGVSRSASTRDVRASGEAGGEGSGPQSPVGGKAKLLGKAGKKSFRESKKTMRNSASFRQRRGSSSSPVSPELRERAVP